MNRTREDATGRPSLNPVRPQRQTPGSMEISNIRVLILSSLFETMSSLSFYVVENPPQEQSQLDLKENVLIYKRKIIKEFKTDQQAADYISSLKIVKGFLSPNYD